MSRWHRWKVLLAFMVTLCFTVSYTPNLVSAQPDEGLYERQEGYYTVVDEEDQTLLKTARKLTPGNKFLNHQNQLFRITEVTDDTAHAEFVEDVDLPTVEVHSSTDETLASGLLAQLLPAQGEGAGPVGVYHSHGAESYVPSDGEESIDEGGGILQVGQRLAESLEHNGVSAKWSQETHVPHDAGAYMRSRRTVEEMLQQNPEALLDVHRDAAPKEEYKAEIEGEERVQILFVIGQQQQNIEETENFAQELKATADEMYPELVKGVLYAEGDYNQDMHPNNLLLEVGGHENTREGAEESAELFGEVVAANIQGGNGGAAGLTNGGVGGAGGILGTIGRSILWIGLAVVLGGGIFLLINEGSFEKALERLKGFVTTEFANYLGPSRRRKSLRNRGKFGTEEEEGSPQETYGSEVESDDGEQEDEDRYEP